MNGQKSERTFAMGRGACTDLSHPLSRHFLRTLLRSSILSAVCLGIAIGASQDATAQESVETRIGTLDFTKDFENGYPTDETVQKLYDEMDFQRAVQAYIWSIPLIGFVGWQQIQNEEMGLENGQLVFMETYDEKACCLTLNTTTPYVQTFIDMSEAGPFVIEIPAGGEVRGATHDMWQIQIAQMTRPGKYLFVGPYQEVPPEAEREGYVINRSPMNNFFVGIRLIPEDPKKREALLNQIKLYPYSARENPEQREFARPTTEWYANHPRDMSYWELLHKSIQREPVREIDRYFMGMLKPLGIEKGKPFDPDERQTKILMDALVVGEAMVKANDFEKRLAKAKYREDSRWHFSTTANWNQRAQFYQQLDGAAAWFYEAVTNDEAMHGQETGWGQVYMAAYKDGDGDWLDGAQDYVLNIPKDPPAETFWSVTLYDVSTRAIIQNETKDADLSSREELQVNEDGSIDLYFGPKAPAGKEANWVQTSPERAWFPYFRLYSPTQPFLDQNWVLPNIEKAGG